MTDDEVQQWLSDEERARWPTGGLAYGAQWLRDAYRSLAETRKALVEHDSRSDYRCALCGGYMHTATCLFSTMPRPR